MAKQNRSKIDYGATPSVDLLPDAQRAALLHDRTMPKLLLAIVLSAVVAGLIWAAGTLPVGAADAKLASAEADSQELIAQIAGHSDEQQTLSAVNKLSQAREQLTADEVLFIEVLDEIDDALPSGATIETYTGQLLAPGAEGASGDLGLDLNPLCVADTATITVKFAGDDLGPAPVFARNLEKVTGLSCIVGTKIEQEQDGDPQKVTVQFALGEDALAHRFSEEAE